MDDAGATAELLLLSPSFLTPALDHEGMHVWDTLAIAEFLAEILPEGRAPAGGPRRAHATTARSPAKCIPASPTCARPCR